MAKSCLKDKKNTAEYPLQNPQVRLELETSPSRLIKQIEARVGRPVVFVDEAQKVPEIFDAAQYLIDNKTAQFILTGSSARKLRRQKVNLLPGRVKYFHLDPLLWGELGLVSSSAVKELRTANLNKPLPYSLEDLMVYGSLPFAVLVKEKDRKDFLRSYSRIYIEEEIRSEAISRKIGAFSRFLELAANESGTSPNLTKLSNESGVSQPSVKEFYNILEDTLIVERVEPYLRNARKRILSSPKYYFFDTGVRNALCGFPMSKGLAKAQKGILFEHCVMLEIIRRVRALNRHYKVYYWRTKNGAEVDCVIDTGTKVIPIEIKSSRVISGTDLKGLKIFLADYSKLAHRGYVIIPEGTMEKLAGNITAVPWNEM